MKGGGWKTQKLKHERDTEGKCVGEHVKKMMGRKDCKPSADSRCRDVLTLEGQTVHSAGESEDERAAM